MGRNARIRLQGDLQLVGNGSFAAGTGVPTKASSKKFCGISQGGGEDRQ